MKITTCIDGFVQTDTCLIETPVGNLPIDAPEGVTVRFDARGVRVRNTGTTWCSSSPRNPTN